MKYLLVIPKGSYRDIKDDIRLLDGVWNEIGYAFDISKKDLVLKILAGRETRNILEVPWKGTFQEYKEFILQDRQYIKVTNLKIEITCLKIMEEMDGKSPEEN